MLGKKEFILFDLVYSEFFVSLSRETNTDYI